MSEITVLSNQYNKLVTTSEKANDSVITYKKFNLLNDEAARKRYPKLNVAEDDKNDAKQFLLKFLRNVKKIVTEESSESDFIPNIAIDEYRSTLSKKNQFLKEDLDKIIKCLDADLSIKSEDLTVLDNILIVTDKARSDLFKRLRTARG